MVNKIVNVFLRDDVKEIVCINFSFVNCSFVLIFHVSVVVCINLSAILFQCDRNLHVLYDFRLPVTLHEHLECTSRL